MTTTLDRNGQLSYTSAPGAVAIGVLSRTEITGTPVYDAAGRTVTSVRYAMTVEMWIGGSGTVTTDSDMESLRKVLQTPGGQLRVSAIGFGNNSIINVEGGSRDCMWGPLPRLLSWRSAGSNKAAHVRWQVDWAVAECERDPKKGLTAMESTYRISFGVDKSGYSRRSVSISVRIPQTRKTPDSRAVEFSADQLRQEVTPQPLDGFRRVQQEWNIDESKNVLTGTIVDEEMPLNCPPPGVTEVSASQEITSQSIPNTKFTMWQARISASYEVAKDVPRLACLGYFEALLRSRLPNAQHLNRIIDQALADIQQDINRVSKPANRAGRKMDFGEMQAFNNLRSRQLALIKLREGGSAVILRQVTMSEPEIYGKRAAAFQAIYSFVCSLDTVVSVSGLWKSTGGDWRTWKTSLETTMFHPRGYAKLEHLGKHDVIVDLCEPAPSPTSLKGMIPKKNLNILEAKPAGALRLGFFNDVPPPERSWIGYEGKVDIETTDETVEMKPLPQRARDVEPRPPAKADQKGFRLPRGDGKDRRFIGDAGGPLSPEEAFVAMAEGVPPQLRAYSHANTTPPIIQTRAAPSVYAIFEGFALRAGYPIAIPGLTEVGGFKAIPANRDGYEFAKQDIADNWHGVEIHRAHWRLRYLVAGVPQKIEQPKPPTR